MQESKADLEVMRVRLLSMIDVKEKAYEKEVARQYRDKPDGKIIMGKVMLDVTGGFIFSIVRKEIEQATSISQMDAIIKTHNMSIGSKKDNN
jgi:hypothetical protein